MAFPMKYKHVGYTKLLLFLSLLNISTASSDCKVNNIDDIGMDQAQLNINVSTAGTLKDNMTVTLLTQRTECVSCNLVHTADIPVNSSCYVLLDTRWKTRLAIELKEGMSHSKVDSSCHEKHLSRTFKEYGNYTMYVTVVENAIKCKEITLMNTPSDSNIPIFVALGVLVAVIIIYAIGNNCYKHRGEYFNRLILCTGTENHIEPNPYTCMSQDLGNMQTNINPVDGVETPPTKQRLRSLDTFRGISIIAMIFVNYGGGGYWFFKHSRWNGLTIADLVFPWFVWIMGTSMAFSYKRLLLDMTPKWKIFLKIFKRSCILFLLGLLVNSGGCQFVYLPKFRVPGVLQRFAGTYLVTATIHMIFARIADTNMHKWWSPGRDIIDYWFEWILNLVFVAVHLSITFGLNVPNCPMGYLGPGGLADGGKYSNCTGGAAGYIDRLVFGEEHIYQSPTCKEIYKTQMPYDPEGLLGTLTSCFMCFLGLQAGKILMIYKEPRKIVIRYLIWGVVLCLIAGALCGFSRDGGTIPINKNLWSLSFVLCLGGFAFFLLSFCYLTIDVWKFWNGAPFYYPGMNPLVVYCGHELLHHTFPIAWQVTKAHSSLLPLDVWGTVVWMLVAFQMYRQKIFISV